MAKRKPLPKAKNPAEVSVHAPNAATTSTFDELDPSAQIFVKEYIIDFNGYRAAVEAGYKATSAKARSQRLLANPIICRAIAEAVRPSLQEAELTVRGVLHQLHNFLFYDITPYIAKDGTLLVEPKDLPEAIRQSIQAIEGDETCDRDGNVVKTKLKIRLVPKEGALKLAMQYLKLTDADQTVVQQNFFTQFFQQAQEAVDKQKQLPVTIEATNGKVIKQEVISNGSNGKPKVY